MSTLTLSNETITRLHRAAAEMGEPPEALAEQAIREFLRVETRRHLRREAEAFRAQHTQLRAQFPGEYVAMRAGKVVDHDADQLALLERIERRYPDEPVYIAPVLEQPEESYTVLSPRWESGL